MDRPRGQALRSRARGKGSSECELHQARRAAAGRGLGGRQAFTCRSSVSPDPGSSPALFGGCVLQEAFRTAVLCARDPPRGPVRPAAFLPQRLPVRKQEQGERMEMHRDG